MNHVLPNPQLSGWYDVHIEHGVSVRARDNTILVTDIYRPAESGEIRPGQFPAVVERTPYGRGRDLIVQLGSAAAARGYVFLAQDVRGRGESGGTFGLYMGDPGEGSDGIDTMEWILKQSWCDGRIGSVGGSFSAANQQAMALHQPQGLRAQVLRDAGANYYRRGMRTHGAFNIGLCLPWIVSQAITSEDATRDPNAQRELLHMQENLAHWMRREPLQRGLSPLAESPTYEDLYLRMCETSDDVAFWHSTTARLEGHWDEYPDDVALLLISGWFSHHAGGNFDKYLELGTRSTAPVSLIVGPWVHGPYMLEATSSGDVDFGPAAAEHGPVVGTYLGWLDRSLQEDDLHHDSGALHYFLMGTGDGHQTPEGSMFHGGTWRSTTQWPPPTTRYVTHYLADDGKLAEQPPTDVSSATAFEFDPRNPCPAIGATNLQEVEPPGLLLTGPQDQRASRGVTPRGRIGRPLSERSDVATFQTDPLVHTVEVTGPVEVVLWVTSTAPDTDFTVKLIDSYPPTSDYPEGYAMLLCEDIQRMRYRDDRTVGELIQPGHPYRITMSLGPTSNVFKPGHQIRLDISSSSFPEYDVNPNTGEPLGRHTRTEVAHQTIFHNLARPSYLLLPCQPSLEHAYL